MGIPENNLPEKLYIISNRANTQSKKVHFTTLQIHKNQGIAKYIALFVWFFEVTLTLIISIKRGCFALFHVI